MTRTCRTFLPVLVLALAFLLPSFSFAGEYKVSRVIDGDTIRARDGDSRIIIRLVGIDAPEASHSKNEPGQPFSDQATKHLAGMVLGRTIEFKKFGQDRYGRILGEVFVEGRNINLQMVKDGLAEVYRGTPARGQDVGPYWRAEEEAKKARRGMWQLGEKYVSPREWRKRTYGS